MDTSTRLDFLLGNLRVPANEITPQEWLELLKEVIRYSKPHLKYLVGFEEIGRSMNQHLHGYHSRTTSDGVIFFPQGFSVRTRCAVICSLGFSTEGENLAGPRFGARFVNEEKLLLTQDGQLIYWTAKYERVVQHGVGYRSHRSAIIEFAVESRFSDVGAEDLLLLIDKQKGVGKKMWMMEVLNFFQNSLLKSAEERERRAVELRHRGEAVASLLSRIG